VSKDQNLLSQKYYSNEKFTCWMLKGPLQGEGGGRLISWREGACFRSKESQVKGAVIGRAGDGGENNGGVSY